MTNIVDLIKEKVNENRFEGEALMAKMDEFHEWDSLDEILENINDVRQFFVNVILDVEEVAYALLDEVGAIHGGDKLDAAVELIDSYIDLPIMLELIDGPAIKIALSMLVQTLNTKYGSDWKLDELRAKVEEGVDLITEKVG